MNDRYLFRAKRIDNGGWIIGSLIQAPYLGSIRSWISSEQEDRARLREISSNQAVWRAFEVRNDTICQCTGLKDKNGKLIWENDVVIDDNRNLYKAFWQDRYYQFSWICVKSDKLPIGAKWDFWSIRSYEIDVICNIFDNPELINE